MSYYEVVVIGGGLFGSAAATSMMTIIGIAILLAPVLIRTWKEFKTAR